MSPPRPSVNAKERFYSRVANAGKVSFLCTTEVVIEK